MLWTCSHLSLLSPSACVVAAVAGGLLAPSGAMPKAYSDVVESWYDSPSEYAFRRWHMPDFDQVRDGLPVGLLSLPGGSHCLPACIADLCGYVSMHGVSSIPPFEADWEAQENFGQVTSIITYLGIISGTQPCCGTMVGPGATGLAAFVGAHEPGMFTVGQVVATDTTGPTLQTIALANIISGVSIVGYAWHDWLGTDVYGRQVYRRNGGHAVVFVGGSQWGDIGEIKHMDPSDEVDDTATQSLFDVDADDIELTTMVEADSMFKAVFTNSRRVSRLSEYPRFKVIDMSIHLRPRRGYSWDGETLQWVGVLPLSIGEWNTPPFTIEAPADTHVIDFLIGPFQQYLWYIEEAEPDAVKRVNVIDGLVESFPMPHTVKRFAFSRHHALYLLDDYALTRWHPFAAEGINAPPMVTLDLPVACNMITIDDTADAIWLFSHETGTLFRMLQSADAPPTAVTLPDAWPAGVSVTAIAATRDAEVPLAVLGTDGGVRRLAPAAGSGSTIADTAWVGAASAAIQFNDEGDLLAFGPDGMTMYHRSNDGWSVMGDHPFVGLPFTEMGRVTVSRTNFDPAVHTGEGWDEVLTIPMPGDLNHDEVVDIEDLLLLLAVFGSNDEDADFNGDGVVDVEDLLVLLAFWTTSG